MSSVFRDSLEAGKIADTDYSEALAVTLTFEAENAGYGNMVGVLKVDDAGNPVFGEIVFEDANRTASGETVTAFLEGTTAEQVRYFLIPDGGNRNPGLASGDTVTFKTGADGNWQAFSSNGRALVGANTNILFSGDGSLNPKDLQSASQTRSMVSFEDQLGGNRDFNDLVFRTAVTAGSNGQSDPAPVMDQEEEPDAQTPGPDLDRDAVDRDALAVTLTFEAENAGYGNMVGVLKVDDAGNPVFGEIVFEDANRTASGETVTAFLEGTTAEQVRYFLIPDGGNRNPGLASGDTVTFKTGADGNWQAFSSNGRALVGANTNILFSGDGSLNPKDLQSASQTRNMVSFEDQLGGNRDFNDLVFRTAVTAGSNGQSDPAPVKDQEEEPDAQTPGPDLDRDAVDTEALAVTLTFEAENAGYGNMAGVLKVDDAGNPVFGQIVFEDANRTASGETVTAFLEGTTAEQVRYFLIPDGGNRNPGLASGDTVTFETGADGNWQAFSSNGRALVGANTNILFSGDGSLNPKDLQSASQTRNMVSFEDQLGGNRDFNDLVFRTAVTAGSNGQSDPAPVMDQEKVDLVTDGPVVSVPASGSTVVEGGRVTTLDVSEAGEILSVRVLTPPKVGNLTVNPDGTLALVLSQPDALNFKGALDFTYEITRPDGSRDTVTQTVKVLPAQQEKGWGAGDFYMLQTDARGELVMEHGDNHRAIHVTGNDLALSREEIAELEDMPLNQITGAWLADSVYGRSPHTALDAEAGLMVWDALTGWDSPRGSHWLLFEKGYEYETGRLVGHGAEGESELHPLYIGSYGKGSLPVLGGELRIFQSDSANIVFRDIALGDNFQTLSGGNYIFDGIDNNGQEIGFQAPGAVTLRDSIIADTHDAVPAGKGIWDPHENRVQGLFVNHAQGVLLENNIFDLNGWELDYRYDASSKGGQAPSQFNHNIYISHDAGDITVRDNFILRGASFGAQVRPGGFIEDNVFAGNNIGVNFLGGKGSANGRLTGNYTLFADNIVTSGGFHTVELKQGAITWGVVTVGNQSTLSDNIITHLTEPGTTPEFHPDFNDIQGARPIVNATEERIYSNDTIIYNWAMPNSKRNAPDANVEGLKTSILDRTTIENFTAALLSRSDADVADLAAYLRAQYAGDVPELLDADLVVDYFQNGFGLSSGGERNDSATLRFIPNSLGDGVRWDNRRNWDSDDLPGTVDGDSADLGGNWVIYGGTTTLTDLELGSGGTLVVTHGYLGLEGTLSTGAAGGFVDIDNAGQVWINGYSGNARLDVDLDGGRFANTGRLDGTIDLEITDNGQGLLATAGAKFVLSSGSRLSIVGSDADVGFDGNTNGRATLRTESGALLEFVADSQGFGEIREFRSGHYQTETPRVVSEVDLDGGTLNIDVAALGRRAFEDTLIFADTLYGTFDEVNVLGLGGNRNATVTIDYDTDDVMIELTAKGLGAGETDFVLIG